MNKYLDLLPPELAEQMIILSSSADQQKEYTTLVDDLLSKHRVKVLPFLKFQVPYKDKDNESIMSKPLHNIDIGNDKPSDSDHPTWRYKNLTKAAYLQYLVDEYLETTHNPIMFGDDYDPYEGTWENSGGMKNQKVKKCEKKKVVLGKERCIYKVSGSKKDYMKYKGKLVPVTDYVKYMKKKN